jgi:hypothetical protein
LGVTDVAGNFAKFIGYRSCFGESPWLAECRNAGLAIQPMRESLLQICC